MLGTPDFTSPLFFPNSFIRDANDRAKFCRHSSMCNLALADGHVEPISNAKASLGGNTTGGYYMEYYWFPGVNCIGGDQR
ncbi:MAG: hypothetical protein MJ106_04720 [Lentisphaeria bacterium]|nr:hypothetical protein [Lentisphaeria bacterium]